MNADERRYFDLLTERVLGAVFEVSNALGIGFHEAPSTVKDKPAAAVVTGIGTVFCAKLTVYVPTCAGDAYNLSASHDSIETLCVPANAAVNVTANCTVLVCPAAEIDDRNGSKLH